jgi:murein DD-endopeptidase MepM/ murein hydrolase activator NlpD
VARKLFSGAALFFAGALLIGTTVPANAFLTEQSDPAAGGASTVKLQAQELTVDAEAAAAAAAPVTREALTVTSYAELLRIKYGSRDFTYTVGTGPIRWPFPYSVRISDGFGDRVSPCRGCSSYHKGVDFLPGNGAPIYAIADGVVSVHDDGTGGFGNHVMIDHQIDGGPVTSVYAHMQTGSSPLAVGDVVKVGDFIGLVGATGAVTAPHLHFEIRLDGTAVDPFAWLKAHAG